MSSPETCILFNIRRPGKGIEAFSEAGCGKGIQACGGVQKDLIRPALARNRRMRLTQEW